MVIHDGPGFLVLNQAIKHLQKRPNFEMVVVSRNTTRENMEFHVKFNSIVDKTPFYDCEYYESHDKHPYNFTTSYHDFMLKRKQDHFKFIKMLNGDKSVTLYEEPKNPDQLKLSTENEPFMFPGECMICGESDYRNGLFCRVNCPAGHVFHCGCIERWRNTPQVNPYFESGWQNGCPICRADIDTVSVVRNLNKFGKRKLNDINNDIVYLLKKG